MSIGYLAAVRLLRRSFSRRPPGQQLHILLRFLTCPFQRTLDVIPAGARLLDIGAGHGTFALLALQAGASDVVCLEPDLRKASRPGEPRIRWVAGFDDCIRGRFDVISMFDVTYLLTLEQRAAIYHRAFANLRPGGTLLLKELDPAHGMKARWARLQEQLNETFLHVTLGSGFVLQTRDEVQRTLAAIGFHDFRIRAIDRGYPHAHVLYTARKPAAGQGPV